MKQLYGDLWQTSLEHPFPNLNTHAYFLQREAGNVLFYNTSNIDDLEEITNLGGISFQYLSHRHESGNSLSIIKNKFNSQLCTGFLEEPFVETDVDVIFSKRQSHSSNIEIIPTPGHTDGGLCFYYESPIGPSYLFTGDTFFQSNGQWRTLVISNDGGNAEKLIESLSTIRTLNPNVVLCSASVGEVSVVEVTEEEWHETIDTNISQLSRHA